VEGFVIHRHAVTVSTSNADDAAFRALNDVALATTHIDDTRVIGGQMVGLLLAAFPTEGTIVRRTVDADTAVSIEIAASGVIHDALTGTGYTAVDGNRYETEDGRVVDVVVPSDNHFRQIQLGGRGFDAAPGLRLVLAADPILLDVDVTLTDESRRGFSVKVPPVELALVLKALTLRSRMASKDLVDIYNLLQVSYYWDAEHVGGWAIGESALSGARGDAQVQLHKQAETAGQNQDLVVADVPPEVLVALIRAKVGAPRGQ
jgi:hypothetical protein